LWIFAIAWFRFQTRDASDSVPADSAAGPSQRHEHGTAAAPRLLVIYLPFKTASRPRDSDRLKSDSVKIFAFARVSARSLRQRSPTRGTGSRTPRRALPGRQHRAPAVIQTLSQIVCDLPVHHWQVVVTRRILPSRWLLLNMHAAHRGGTSSYLSNRHTDC
jgi:hypothetical protein